MAMRAARVARAVSALLRPLRAGWDCVTNGSCVAGGLPPRSCSFGEHRYTRLQSRRGITLPAPDRFGFTKLLVAHLETSATFYKSVFGLVERGRVRSEIADRKIDEIMFEPQEPGGATFVLLHFDGVTSPSSEEVILGFITTDLTALIERAKAAGGEVAAPARNQPEHGVNVAFVNDNEGHLIEVVELI